MRHSVLSRGARVGSYSEVQDSILYDNVKVGRHAKLRRVIVDKMVEIPEKVEIGYDLEQDRERFSVTDGGVVVVTQDMIERLT